MTVVFKKTLSDQGEEEGGRLASGKELKVKEKKVPSCAVTSATLVSEFCTFSAPHPVQSSTAAVPVWRQNPEMSQIQINGLSSGPGCNHELKSPLPKLTLWVNPLRARAQRVKGAFLFLAVLINVVSRGNLKTLRAKWTRKAIIYSTSSVHTG